MKTKQIKHGHWKNQIVHFNGVQHKVIDCDVKTKFFKIDDEKQEPFSVKWIHNSLIVWS